MCEDLVSKHPHWTKERILAVFPEYEPVIDLAMDI
jgi:hypothetical protein